MLRVCCCVQVLTWVPQNDILAHPNLRAFLSHVGINSMYEVRAARRLCKIFVQRCKNGPMRFADLIRSALRSAYKIIPLLCRPSTMESRLYVCRSLQTSPRMLTEWWQR